MATIIEVPVVIDSTLYSHETHVRSGGLHLSHIIRSIEETYYKQFKGDGMESQALESYRMVGFLFERALYDIVLKDAQIQRLGEFEKDGVVCTPDAINLTTGRGIESKCTFRSMAHDATDERGEFGSWWTQMKGYAEVLGIYDWDLWVTFMCGDYKANRRPTMRHWEIGFTVEEVRANWKMITNHGKWMIEKGLVK